MHKKNLHIKLIKTLKNRKHKILNYINKLHFEKK